MLIPKEVRMKKKKSTVYLTKAVKRLTRYKKAILEGCFVAIDPSCVSQSSLPGYALFQEGECIETGVLDIPYHPSLSRRLYRINKLIERCFGDVDLAIIEEVPRKPLRKSKTMTFGMSSVSFNSLQRAIGAIMCAFPEEIPVTSLEASVWHMIAKRNDWKVNKEDDEDALLIGSAAIYLLRRGGDIEHSSS
jgi:hypothetical protein